VQTTARRVPRPLIFKSLYLALPHLFRTLVAKNDGAKFKKYLTNPPYVPFDTNIDAASLVKNVWVPLEDHGSYHLLIGVF